MVGPLDSQAVRRLAAAGRLGPQHLVRKGTQGEWVFAHRIKGLFSSGHAPTEVGVAPTPQEAAPVAAPPESRRRLPDNWWFFPLGLASGALAAGIPLGLWIWMFSSGGNASTSRDIAAAPAANTLLANATPAVAPSLGEIEPVVDNTAVAGPAIVDGPAVAEEPAVADKPGDEITSSPLEAATASAPPAPEAQTPDSAPPAVDPPAPPPVALAVDPAKADPAAPAADGERAARAEAELRSVAARMDLLNRKFELHQTLRADRAKLESDANSVRKDLENYNTQARIWLANRAQRVAELEAELKFANASPTAIRGLEAQIVALTQNLATVQQSIDARTDDMKRLNEQFEELKRREDDLKGQWLDELDPFGLQPRRYQVEVAEQTRHWLASDNEFAAGRLLRGFAQIHRGAPLEGVNDFTDVMTLLEQPHVAPSEVNTRMFLTALAGRGKAYEAANDFEKANVDLGAVLGKNQNFVLARIFRGMLCHRQDQRRSALREFGRAINSADNRSKKKDPSKTAPYREAARVLVDSADEGELKLALRYAFEACENSGYKDWASLEIYAWALARNKSPEKAEEHFALAMDLAPSEHWEAIDAKRKLLAAGP
jgi:hypothetical protein